MTAVPKWELFELTLQSPEIFANPFLQVEVQGLFASEAGEFRVDGFYDGDGQWKIRFAPHAEGLWRYETFSDEPSLPKAAGEFQCIEPVSRGALALRPEHPHWFFSADGKALRIINDGWYHHPVLGKTLPHEGLDFGTPSEEDFRLHLRMLAGAGVNMLIETDQLYARQCCIRDKSYNWPWEPAEGSANGIRKDFFNLAYFQRMDRSLAYAKSLGIYYGYELMQDNSVYRELEWSHHPWNRSNGGWIDADPGEVGWPKVYDLDNQEHMLYVERYMKYTLSRISAYWNIFWEIGTESGNLAAHRPGIVPIKTLAAWFSHWSDYLGRKDIYGRLATVGDAGEIPELLTHRSNHFNLTQEHSPMDTPSRYARNIRAFGRRFWRWGKPTVVGEQDKGNCGRFALERVGYWAAFASGFYMGRVDRHFPIARDGALTEGALFCGGEFPPIYGYLSIMAKFIDATGIRYWLMAPRDDLPDDVEGTVCCLAEPDFEYLLYFPEGGKASLDLPRSTSSWFNPRTGEFTAQSENPPGRMAFATPDGEDWALYVRL